MRERTFTPGNWIKFLQLNRDWSRLFADRMFVLMSYTSSVVKWPLKSISLKPYIQYLIKLFLFLLVTAVARSSIFSWRCDALRITYTLGFIDDVMFSHRPHEGLSLLLQLHSCSVVIMQANAPAA